jgi:cyclase
MESVTSPPTASLLKARIIPSLLLRGGRLVKGVSFGRYSDAGNPITTARAHNAQGADELILLDIDASREHRGPDIDSISSIAAECFMPLAVGGGITSLDRARAVVEVGADKIVLNSGALDRPHLIEETARVFGAQAVVVAVDMTRQDGEVAVYDHRRRAGTARRVVDWAKEAVDRGGGELRLCSVDREGSRTGLDLDALELVRSVVHVPVVIEGGAGTLSHVQAAIERGADGVALGTLLVFSDNNIVKVRRFLATAGLKVRI